MDVDSNPATIRYLPATEPVGRVGIVANSFESAYYNRLVESASNYLTARGFLVVVQSNLHTPQGELQAFESLANNQCDGLIIHSDTLDDEVLNDVMRQYPNAVLLNRHLPLFPERCVEVDNIQGGEVAARYLTSLGHRHIAMVNGPEKYLESNDRAAGFKRVLKTQGIELVADLPGRFVQDCGERAMEKIHEQHSNVSAVFFHNDVMAFGALNACRRLGIKVPEHISIMGFDGIPMCEYVSPKLTSVQQPMREIGEQAAKIICDLLLSVKPDKRYVGTSYTPVLAERESVSPPMGHSTETVSLTQRESECLTWTANGKTSWEISVILGVSESTATFHLRNAGVKLKASNRAHAVAKALQLGLIEFS